MNKDVKSEVVTHFELSFGRCYFLFLSHVLKKIDSENRELILQSGTAFGAKIISAALALMLTALITRALGAQEAGYYFWALALITVMATLARAGFDQALLRFMSSALVERRIDQAYAIYRYAMKTTFCIAAIIAVLAIMFSPLLSHWIFASADVAKVISIMAVAGIFLALNTLQSQSLLAAKRILTSIFVLEIGVPLMMIAFMLMTTPSNSVGVSALYLFSSVILVLAFSRYWRQRSGSTHVVLAEEARANIDRVRKNLFGVAGLSLISQWGGILLLGWFADSAQIALFSIALRVAMLNSFILRAVNAVVGARFARLYHVNDIAGLRKLSLQSSRLMAVVAAPMLIFLLLCGRSLLSIFGAEFITAATCLAILSVGQFINVITGAVCLLLEMTGGESKLRRYELVAALIMIALGFALIPFFGATGAAIATACSVASVNLLATYEVNRRFGFNMLRIW